MPLNEKDLYAVHGLDAESELARILSAEILEEMNKEIIKRIYLPPEMMSHNEYSRKLNEIDEVF